MDAPVAFYVAGLKYQGPSALLVASNLEHGQLLKLVPEPDNEHDPNAVGLVVDNVRIGYIPNHGLRCSRCWKAYSLKDCKCEAEWSPGLATCILVSGELDSVMCYVSDVYPDEPVHHRVRAVLVR
jgi:hypothetical protein